MISKLPLFFAILLAGRLPHASAAETPTQVLDGLAAIVNEEIVTFSQVRELTGALETSLRANFSGNQLTDHIKEVRLRALNDLIDRQLILQEFKKMKGEIPRHAIDDRVNAIIREEFGGDKPAFLRTIAAQGFTLDRIRKMEEEKIIVQAMRAREVKSEPLLAPGVIESYYRAHVQEWTTNDQVKLRMIKIVPGSDPVKTRKMMQDIRDKIVRGADFGSLAKVYSQDSTQDNEGDWGWIKRGDLNPEMEQVVFHLPIGKVSDIIELNQTYYLMLAEKKMAASPSRSRTSARKSRTACCRSSARKISRNGCSACGKKPT